MRTLTNSAMKLPVNCLTSVYRIQQDLLTELSNLRNADIAKLRSYLSQIDKEIESSIYRKSALNPKKRNESKNLTPKLAYNLFQISRLIHQLCKTSKDNGFNGEVYPWITFSILNPEYHIDSDHHIENDSNKKCAKYLFYTFGIAEGDDKDPKEWYKYLDSQVRSEDDISERFTISNLIFEKINYETVQGKPIFRILNCISEDDYNQFSAENDSSKQFSDVYLRPYQRDNKEAKARDYLSHGIKRESSLAKSIDTDIENIQVPYKGLITYTDTISHYMGTKQSWCLYGFPILSFLTGLPGESPHSGVYVLMPRIVSDSLLENIHAILIGTISPIDQLFLIKELKKKIEYSERLNRASHHIRAIKDHLDTLRSITREVEHLAEIIDPNAWNPGFVEYKKLSELFSNFFDDKDGHNPDQYINNDAKAKNFIALFDNNVTKKSLHVSMIQDLYHKLVDSRLADEKVFIRMFDPFLPERLQHEFSHALYLSKCISKLNLLSAYWIALVLNEDSKYDNLDYHSYYSKINDGSPIRILIALAKLQRFSQVAYEIDENNIFSIRISINNRPGEPSTAIQEMCNAINQMHQEITSSRVTTALIPGETTRIFQILLSGGMVLSRDAEVSVSNERERNLIVDAYFQLIKF